MKKFNLLLLGCFISLFSLAQKSRTVSGAITTNTTFYSDTVYTLDGYVFVKNNAVLTIQPGTVVKGKAGNKSTLIITRNGSIQANGTANRPIVFTSEKPTGQRNKGDWGGVVILGKAIINRPTDCTTCPGSTVAASETGIQNAIEGDLDNAAGDALYGGTDNNHSSGVFRYVRIEFAGTVITPGNEINGLTFGGVGKGTTVEYVQVSFADDDAFEWFGGNVNAKYLVSHRNVDDDLDTDFGFSGKIQFAICQRDSALFDIGSGPTTNGFESDNDAAGTEATPNTEAVFSNITVLGPLANGKPLGYSNSFQNAARIRRNSSMSLFNSVVMGYPDAIFVDGARSSNKFQNDTLFVKNNILAGNLRAVNASTSGGSNPIATRAKLFASGNDSIFSSDNILFNPFSYLAPDFRPALNSPANSGASFIGSKISDPFFTQTSFKGAMGSENWTNCWCNFDPQTADYTNGNINNMPLTYDAGKDSAICSGKSLVIGQNLTGAYKALWMPATGLSSITAARPTANPSVTTKYFVTISDSITGCFLMDSILVTVNPNPSANFTSVAGATGLVTFTNTSTNATTYSWNFGDGNNSTSANPTHTYAANGVYNVTLTATSGACINVTSRQVNASGIASQLRAFTGDITSNTTFYNDTIYIINGYTYVKNNAVLTIQPGTIIKGGANKASLIITRNGSIIANGTKNQPIVFTSGKPAGQRNKGDWGGVVILGKAVINRPTDCTTCPGSAVAAGEAGIQNAIEGDLDNATGDALYGGNDNNHSSGSLKYVRIEYAGTVITPGNEINGLTMGGLGKGTTLEHIQVSFADDDAFEWFGGNVNAKYLVSYRNVDDDLDVDFGFSGKVQFAICQRDSALFDIGSGPTTNGFESDNDAAGTEAKPYTDPTFSNITVLGPLANGIPLGYSNSFQNGARIRRNSSTSLFNSIIMGYPDAVFIDGARSVNKNQNDTLLFKNNILAGNLRAVNASTSGGSNPVATRAKLFSMGNDSIASSMGVLVDPFNYINPVFAPAPGSPANSGASFSGSKISDAFFAPTTFRGAMGANPDSNWTNCWCNFDPQNANYSSSPINNPGATANFTAPASSTTLKVDFVNSSSNATAYFWDFGVALSTSDTSSTMSPSFTFPANGTYTVTLTARSKCGNSVVTKQVVINDVSILPVVDFNYSQNSGAGSREFNFTNTTVEKGLTITYTWYFGDGATANTKDAVHSYAANGDYTIKLVAEHIYGKDSVSKTIKVLPTNVKEVSATFANYQVYPNPTSESTFVSFDLIKSNEVSVQVLDITGKLVMQTEVSQLNAGLNKIELPTAQLPQGMYFVMLHTAESTISTRLVVIK
ncbi:MAG: PKD domain-containing protein [bacterium]|nr:PKD domain-containing protein [bacterium]